MPRFDTKIKYNREYNFHEILELNFAGNFIVIKQFFVKEHDFCPSDEFIIFKDINKLANFLATEIQFI